MEDEKQWFVHRTGREPVGPVSLASIRRGVAAEKIPADSLVTRPGATSWTPVGEFLAAHPEPDAASAAHVADPFMTGMHPAVRPNTLPPAPRKLARRSKLLAGAAIGVVALAAGGVLAFRKLAARTPAVQLSIPAEKLPNGTTMVADARLRDDLDETGELPPEFLASALAEIACGGTDVADLMPKARGKTLAELEKLGFLKLGGDSVVRSRLQCGEALRSGLSSQRVTTVRFEEGEARHQVNVVTSTLDALPTSLGFVRHNFSSLDGFCLKPEGAKTDCEDGMPAAAKDGSRWIFGRVEAVEAFARAYTTARVEVSSSGEILRTTAADVDAADAVSIFARPESVPWALPCERAAPVAKRAEFLVACFPKNVDRIVKNVETKVRGLGIERDLLARASSVGFSFVLLARDDEAAREIEADLLDLSRDWRAHVGNNEAEMTKLVRADKKFIHDAMWQTVFDTFLRALKNIKVERSGSVVRFTIREKFNELEAKTLREFLETQRSDEEASIQIVRAMAAGDPMPAKALATFVEPELATWMASPRSDAGMCAEMRKKLVGVTPNPLPPEEFGRKFELEQRYGDPKCVGQAWSRDWKKCLSDAKDFAGLAPCKPLPSPFGSALARKLQGAWLVESASGDLNTSARLALVGTKLEIKEGELALKLGTDPVRQVPADVESAAIDDGTISFPGDEQPQRVKAKIDGDKLVIGPLGKASVVLTLKRGEYPSLLAAPQGEGAKAAP